MTHFRLITTTTNDKVVKDFTVECILLSGTWNNGTVVYGAECTKEEDNLDSAEAHWRAVQETMIFLGNDTVRYQAQTVLDLILDLKFS